DSITGDSNLELVFTAYFPNQKRARLYILDPDSPNPLVCSRDFAEHIWSIPLVTTYSGSIYIVIGGGGNDSGGNLYVLNSSCNIVKTISFAGHLKEGFLADVNIDGNMDWVGGLTQPNGANYAVFVSNIFGAHTTSYVLLGVLSSIAGRNTIRGPIPVDADGNGSFESAFFAETAQSQSDVVRWSYVSVVNFSTQTIRWRNLLNVWVYSNPVAGDFDGMGTRREVLVGGLNGAERETIFMFDALLGVTKLFYPLALREYETVGAFGLYIDDIDNDGRMELLVAGDKGCFYSFELGARKWQLDVKHFRRNQLLNGVW
ncbi:MAG: hypothetical protein N2254_03890, partial [bacterium]|nr:hypothetical protein [bacterium]